MKQRTLGQLKTPVSALGYGAMSFSDFYGPTDDEKSFAILDRCIELDITHIDTANVYGGGKSETRIGQYLQKQGKQAQDFFTIATKAGIARKEDGTRHYNNSFDYLESELDKSLQRLGVEQVELFYVHRRDDSVDIEEVADALARLKMSGKTRQVGFSEIAPTSLARAQKVCQIAAVQSEYSLATRSPELGLLQKCEEIGASFVAFSPIGRSYLTDNPLSFEICSALAFLKVNPRFNAENYHRNIAATDAFRSLAADMGVAASGLAIAWLLAKAPNIIPIPGTRSVKHLNELASGAELTLSESDLGTIESILPLGWCHGDRYSDAQWKGPERYC